jgi:surface protein
MFQNTVFNGDISKWNTSNVTEMAKMFSNSKFNGDISKWNTSNVKYMQDMFNNSIFNDDISQWNVSSVKDMTCMFLDSKFDKDISNWKPYNLEVDNNSWMFLKCPIVKPYWFNFVDITERKKAIDTYHLHKELNSSLTINKNNNKRNKPKI